MRSGSPEVWLSKSDGSSPVRITNFGGPVVGFPNWSPDASSIVFHARPEGQADLFVVPAAGGNSEASDDESIRRHSSQLFTQRPLDLLHERAFGPDPDLENAGGRRRSRTSDHVRRIQAFESQDGKTVFYLALDNTAIWRVSADGGQSVKVVDAWHDYPSGFDVTAEGIYYAASQHSGEQRFIQFFSFSTAKSRPVVLAHRPFDFGMTVSPESKYVSFDQQDEIGSDLMLVEDFSIR